jgi:hypothetical protein
MVKRKKVQKDKQRSTKEEFEDSKGIIRIRKSKNDRQHNGQKKKDKRTNNDLRPSFALQTNERLTR